MLWQNFVISEIDHFAERMLWIFKRPYQSVYDFLLAYLFLQVDDAPPFQFNKIMSVGNFFSDTFELNFFCVFQVFFDY